MKCSVCQTESSGAYCPSCGAPLEGVACRSCEAPLVAGANFCIHCGEAVRDRKDGALGYVAVGAIAALLVIAAFAWFGQGRTPSGGSGGFAVDPAAGGAGMVAPPLTGSPREQADQLFNRIMQAAATGDRNSVEFFVPMGIAAYRQAGELDADGLYHLSVLESTAGELASALETARSVLREDPDHLLALGAAARAAVSLGDVGSARGYYQRLRDAYERERATERPEYLDHSLILPEYLAEAEAFLDD